MQTDENRHEPEFVSLAVVDNEMAARLVRRFVAAIVEELDEDEQRFFAELDEPELEVSLGEPKQIRFRHFGNESTTDWDGTEEGAAEFIHGAAKAHADNVAADYWMTGGWRTWTQPDP